ncbi:MAG: hypothetical protein LBI18_11870 [Planctomycetaceae bacterium]|nr:hypothetical protein [Planctomycetaceae bacterium]
MKLLINEKVKNSACVPLRKQDLFSNPSRKQKSTQVGDVSLKVGDVSPKHHVGGSRLAPVFGWQFVLPNGLESDCCPGTGAELPYGNATFRRKVAHLVCRRIFIHGRIAARQF